MINKIAHIIWIGGKMPKFQKEIVEKNKVILAKQGFIVNVWDNDAIASYFTKMPDRVTKAMLENKYAIAVDYFRLQLVKKYGGIYIDCDHELIKPIPELALDSDIFVGRLPSGYINNSIFGAKKNHSLIRDLLREMNNKITIHNMIDGHRVESLFLFGEVLDEASVVKLPSEYMYPFFPGEKTTGITSATFAISRFSFSWSDKWYIKLCNYFGLKKLSLFIRGFTNDNKHF